MCDTNPSCPYVDMCGCVFCSGQMNVLMVTTNVMIVAAMVIGLIASVVIKRWGRAHYLWPKVKPFTKDSLRIFIGLKPSYAKKKRRRRRQRGKQEQPRSSPKPNQVAPDPDAGGNAAGIPLNAFGTSPRGRTTGRLEPLQAPTNDAVSALVAEATAHAPGTPRLLPESSEHDHQVRSARMPTARDHD